MIKKQLLTILLLCPLVVRAEALDPLVMQLHWVTQTQFAGYYVALDRGLYEKHGLDVTILSSGPNLTPSKNLQSGRVDVIIDWLPNALVRREQGAPIVQIAQIFDHSGYVLACRKDHGVEKLEDLDGKRIGSWFVGDEENIMALLREVGINADIYQQNFDVTGLVRGETDCISTMRYNEYLQVLNEGMREEEITAFDFDRLGYATLEDGLYVLESSLEDPQIRDRLVRFIAATIEGWEYTIEHPKEALEIVLDHDPIGSLDEHHQWRMLEQVLQLLHADRGQIGHLRPEAYQQTIKLLLDSRQLLYSPVNAVNDQLWKEARQLIR